MGDPLDRDASPGDKLDYLIRTIQELERQLGEVKRLLASDAEHSAGAPSLKQTEIEIPELCRWVRQDDDDMLSGCGHLTEVPLGELHPLFCPHCNRLTRLRLD